MVNTKRFYRYEIDVEGHSLDSYPPIAKINLYEFVSIKETLKGYWIVRSGNNFYSGKKWIPKQSKKRYAYPTKDEAIVNLVKRTEIRIGYLDFELNLCKNGLERAKARLNTLSESSPQ